VAPLGAAAGAAGFASTLGGVVAGRAGRPPTRSGETISGGSPADHAAPERQKISSGIRRSRVLKPVSRKRCSPVVNFVRPTVSGTIEAFDKLGDFTRSLAENPVQRLARLNDWLIAQLPGKHFELSPASADASFRRYFRVRFTADGSTRIVMDAPPEHEDTRPWLQVAALFGSTGAHVPEVFAQDPEQGFLLLSDLGSTTYRSALTADNAAALYADALGALIAIQGGSRPGVLPEYSRELLLRELMLFPDWYVARHKGVTLDERQRATLLATFDKILAVNLAEPQVFVHRDYHSRNLMYIADGANPGILDFQDAVYGPLTYDLASLFKDAYIHWEEDFTLDLLARYWEAARKLGLPVRADFSDFHRDYEWIGVQRHIKVLGIFARLCYRDGKEAYLADMPLVMDYLRRACRRYRDLGPLLKLLDQLDPEPVEVGYTF
jgi:aminoglycoside/choline kinase family phosphotransferase